MHRLKPKQQTRADYYGVNANRLAKDTKAKIERIRTRIEQVQEPWMDFDQAVTSAVNEVIAALDKLKQTVAESADYLNESFE